MSAYTNIAKPTDSTYTNVDPLGKHTYDDSEIAYDDSTEYYDGIDQFAYTNLAKPVGTPYTNIAKPTT